ncbi:MAG TPA: DUF1874 domain-containing protein [Deltaproteobacteria bacterium]|nr:DUF1874 domain-containing protein [Deltaproteobacteria bacterium]
MTTHWFYTFGKTPQPACYLLPDGQAIERSFVLPALLDRGWPEVAAANATFHGFVTNELKRPIQHPESAYQGQSPVEVFRAQLEPGLATRVTRTWQDPDYNVDDRDLGRVVDRVLSTVSDGDVVLIELTNGLRHVTTGLLLAAGLLRTLHPGLEVRAVTYADFSSDPVPEGVETQLRRASRIHDLAPMLELFSWAVAGDAFSRSLDPKPLIELLSRWHGALNRGCHEGRLDGQAVGAVQAVRKALAKVGPALALGWPRDVAEALARTRRALGELIEGDAARVLAELDAAPAAHALRIAAGRLDGLTAVDADPDVLDVERLRFDLDLVEQLRDASRHGDAVRILREWLVNATLLAHGEAEGWLDHTTRQAAEARLWQQTHVTELGRHWAKVTALRNAASHARMNASHEARPASIATALDEVPAALRVLVGEGWLLAPLRWEPKHSPRRWLANALSLNMIGSLGDRGRLTVTELQLDDARALSWESCVGHEDTAAVLSTLLGRPVEVRRVTVKLEGGDELLVAQLDGPRLPAGARTLPAGARFRWFLVSFEGS